MTGTGAWALAALRLWALLRMQTVWRRAVGPAWPVSTIVLAMLWAPMISSGDASFGAGPWWWLALSELALGTILGGATSLGGHAIVGAAQWQAFVWGLPPRPWTMLTACGAAVVALAVGLHHAACWSLQEIFVSWPVGRLFVWMSPAFEVTDLVALARALLVLGFALASPVVLVGAIVELVVPAIVGSGPYHQASVAPLALGLRVVAAWIALAAAFSTEAKTWAEAATLWPPLGS